MKKLAFATIVGTALAWTAPLNAQLVGPTAYLSQADSPFNPAAFTTFYLEDVEDGVINTPGLSVTGPSQCISNTDCFIGSLIDSVGNGGDQTVGHSIWAAGSLTITFDPAVLGAYPTAAGIVWTDGINPVTFEAFDQNGVSLGVLLGNHADGDFSGGTAEDRFYGATNPGGISRLTISDPSGIEADHIQYGLLTSVVGVPEPGSWALILLGFGAMGLTLRKERRRILPGLA